MIEDTHLIELKGVSRTFDETPALKNINLYIRKREFVTLLGPSGCGKTTMLRIIGGFEHADEGQVLFEGKDIASIPPYKRRINTVFQKYALFKPLNVFDNIAFGLKQMCIRDRSMICPRRKCHCTWCSPAIPARARP